MVDMPTIINIFRTNYKGKYHVRRIAKLVNKNHTTILPYLKKLEKDKILKIKIEGRNKEYSINFDNLLSKEYIVAAEKTETINYLKKNFLIKKIVENILKLNLQGSLVLFGSYAGNYKTEASDIDLLYVGSISTQLKERVKDSGKLYNKTINLKAVSIKQFESALKDKDILIKEVIGKHIMLQNSDLFVTLLWRYYGR